MRTTGYLRQLDKLFGVPATTRNWEHNACGRALAIEILSCYVPEAWQTVFRETAERGTKARESLAL